MVVLLLTLASDETQLSASGGLYKRVQPGVERLECHICPIQKCTQNAHGSPELMFWLSFDAFCGVQEALLLSGSWQ